MAFQADTFAEPCLQLGVFGFNRTRHDADRSPSVDRLQSLKDRSQVGFVSGRISHVIDRQHDNAFDPFFAHPAGGGESRKVRLGKPDFV